MGFLMSVLLPIALMAVIIFGVVQRLAWVYIPAYLYLAWLTLGMHSTVQYLALSISLMVMLYVSIFGKAKDNERLMTRYLSKYKSGFDKINKLNQLEMHKKSEKILKVYKTLRLINDDSLNRMKMDLKISGNMNPDKYIDEFFADYPLLIMATVGIVFLTIMFYILASMLGGIIEIISIIFDILCFLLVFFCLFSILFLKMTIKDKKNKAIKNIDNDYYKLFEHIYFYYGTEGRTYLLADVMSKFSANVSFEMSCLVDSLIDDCKMSERKALENMKNNYSESLKIVNLADKMIKCIDGFALGSETLKGLYDQMIAEEDLMREQRETRKNEIYVFIMIITVGIAFLSELAGIIITMILEVL